MSASHHAADPKQNLENLGEAFSIGEEAQAEETPTPETITEAQNTNEDASKWESDNEILQSRVIEDESIPNNPEPVVPIILREPSVPPHHHCHTEVEHLADAAGPLPVHERRCPRAAVGTAMEPGADKSVSDHCISVGVTEIEGKFTEKARKHAYHEALLAAENTNLHDEPIDVRDTQKRLDWSKWKVAMEEELNSLKQHGTYE